jgi:hypothetical protein
VRGVVRVRFWDGAGYERTAGYVAAEIVVVGLVAHLDGGIRTMLGLGSGFSCLMWPKAVDGQELLF